MSLPGKGRNLFLDEPGIGTQGWSESDDREGEVVAAALNICSAQTLKTIHKPVTILLRQRMCKIHHGDYNDGLQDRGEPCITDGPANG
jgi:hypothetical protein